MPLTLDNTLSSIAYGALQPPPSPNSSLQSEILNLKSEIPSPPDLSHTAGMDRISRAVALNESFHLAWLEALAPLASSDPASLDINKLTQSTNSLHRLTSIRKTLIFLEDTLTARANRVNRPPAPVTDYQALDYAETLLTRMASNDPSFARALAACNVDLAHEFALMRTRHAVPDALASQAKSFANELAHKLSRDHIAHGDAFYRAAQTMLNHADPPDSSAGILPASDPRAAGSPSTSSTIHPSHPSHPSHLSHSQSTIPMAPVCPTLTLDQLNQAIASLDANIALLTGLPLPDSIPTTHNSQPTTLASTVSTSSTPSTVSTPSTSSTPQSEILNLRSEIPNSQSSSPP